jgi:ABC-2 type transport system ATP-binding protein
MPANDNAMPLHLEVIDLTKRFRDFTAVDNISFGIREGICFGLLGPNGAGKTTTIEVIEGIKVPSSGELLFRGRRLDHRHGRDRRFAERAGIQFQSTALMDFLTVSEVLKLFGSLYPRAVPTDDLVRLCQLEEFLERRANKLSGGQKQRLLLALALINDPEIVFLDEPTTGLDPQSRRNFWELITTIKRRGKTVVLTTHYMDEAEQLCDELIIMDHGRIVDQGSPRALLDKHLPLKRVCLDLGRDIELGDLSGHVARDRDNGGLTIETASVETTLQELIARRVDLSSLRVRNPTLEDLFLKLTGHMLRE